MKIEQYLYFLLDKSYLNEKKLPFLNSLYVHFVLTQNKPKSQERNKLPHTLDFLTASTLQLFQPKSQFTPTPTSHFFQARAYS